MRSKHFDHSDFFHHTRNTKSSCKSYSGSASIFSHKSITSLTLSNAFSLQDLTMDTVVEREMFNPNNQSQAWYLRGFSKQLTEKKCLLYNQVQCS